MNLKSIVVVLGIPIFLLKGCANVNESNPSYRPTGGWQISTPEEQGMDSKLLGQLFEYLDDQGRPIHSLLLVRNGYMVAEGYFYPFEENMVHAAHSIAKSFTSTLAGIAIDQGYVDGVNKRVLEIFSERKYKNLTANKEAMTLKHLLTMTAGLDWSQFAAPRGHPDNIVDQMMQSDDWVQFILDQEMAERPGTRFNYCNGCSHLLSAMVQVSTGVSTRVFAEENLFKPLGISEALWKSDPTGVVDGGDGLYLKPRDMAKFGYLYLNGGVWEGEQVVPAEWVAASVKKQTARSIRTDYGYQWWIRPSLNGYEALGYGGQHIVVIPRWDMVMVVTSAGMSNTSLARLFKRYIKPAVKSSGPLPANPEGVELLKSVIEKAGRPTEPKMKATLPEIVSKVSGQAYDLADNLFSWQSFSLDFEENEAVLELRSGDAEYEWAIGLDRVFRCNKVKQYRLPYYYAVDGNFALKGAWKNETTFQVELRLVNEGITLELTFQFEADGVEVKVKNLIDGRVEWFEGFRQTA